jgi:hypothetical protein
MRTMKSKWDVERAAAWLRRHTWGAGGEDSAPALDQAVVAAAQAEADAAADGEDDELDIAGWPALVAPFYD